MTLKEWCIKQLTDRGLWDHEAEKVFEKYCASADDDLNRRWHDQISGYPKEMLAVILLGMKREALKWIEENKPNHFAKTMFTGELEEGK